MDLMFLTVSFEIFFQNLYIFDQIIYDRGCHIIPPPMKFFACSAQETHHFYINII